VRSGRPASCSETGGLLSRAGDEPVERRLGALGRLELGGVRGGIALDARGLARAGADVHRDAGVLAGLPQRLEGRTELGRDALHDRLDARRELLVGQPFLAAAGAEHGGGEHRGEQR